MKTYKEINEFLENRFLENWLYFDNEDDKKNYNQNELREKLRAYLSKSKIKKNRLALMLKVNYINLTLFLRDKLDFSIKNLRKIHYFLDRNKEII